MTTETEDFGGQQEADTASGVMLLLVLVISGIVWALTKNFVWGLSACFGLGLLISMILGEERAASPTGLEDPHHGPPAVSVRQDAIGVSGIGAGERRIRRPSHDVCGHRRSAPQSRYVREGTQLSGNLNWLPKSGSAGRRSMVVGSSRIR